MAWQDALARVKSVPRTAVGPKTEVVRLYSGSMDWRGVATSPVDLHKAAGLDRNVYAIARCISSEVGTGNALIACAAAETICNESKRKAIEPYQRLVFATRIEYDWTRGKYGEQHGRWASTRQDPDARGVAAAREALAGALGIVPWSTTWFDPKLQDSGSQGGRTLRSDAADIVRKRASESNIEWIGPLPGVDSYRDVMFMGKPPGGRKADPTAALRIIELGRQGQATVGMGSPDSATRMVAAEQQPWWMIVAAIGLIIVV